MKKHWLFPLAFVIALAAPAWADFYTWEDESGVTHITDYPPPANQKSQNVRIHEKSSPSGQADPQAQKETIAAITLYTKNDCPECDRARDFLNARNLTFREYNMDNDQTAAVKRKEIDNSTEVPFAVINRNQVYGFSEAVYDRVLKSPSR
ncbi:MAG: glutaredoxin family protein [Deltaproteobacteria bacterium]|nr:glutaredoxin family protein [Deltaproteobacteria bacterium]